MKDVVNMRDATPEEQECIRKNIDKISVKTGFNFWDDLDCVDEIIEDVKCITIDAKTNKGNCKIIFTDVVEPRIEHIRNCKELVKKNVKLDTQITDERTSIIFDNAKMMIIKIY